MFLVVTCFPICTTYCSIRLDPIILIDVSCYSMPCYIMSCAYYVLMQVLLYDMLGYRNILCYNAMTPIACCSGWDYSGKRTLERQGETFDSPEHPEHTQTYQLCKSGYGGQTRSGQKQYSTCDATFVRGVIADTIQISCCIYLLTPICVDPHAANCPKLWSGKIGPALRAVDFADFLEVDTRHDSGI